MPVETIGLIMSAYFVGYAVGSLLAPPPVEQVGHIRTFAALAPIASAIALAHAIFVLRLPGFCCASRTAPVMPA